MVNVLSPQRGATDETEDMGALVARTDWASTGLGAMNMWPQSLRTAFSICLDSGFPIAVFWSDELIQLYNDAYRPILGSTKHPAALGQRAQDCWTEVWDFIGPMLRGVLHTGKATYREDLLVPLDRNSHLEEAYFTFSYSPIRVEGEGVGGVFCVVAETTDRVLMERRLQTLHALGAQATSARNSADACVRACAVLSENPNDVPFALVYLFDADRSSAYLAGAAGLPIGGPSSVAQVEFGGDPDIWSLSSIATGAQIFVVDDLQRRGFTLEGGVWPVPPSSALVLPLGTSHDEQPLGAIVLGVSPRREIDDAYRAFLEMTAGHVATAIVNARAYEQERQRADALAELDRAKTAFFSNVSHEFRTPLTLMLGPIEQILAGAQGPVPDEQRVELEIVHRNSLRLLRLINTLLDFSRIEAGRVEAIYEPLDLAVLTADLASQFQSAIERAGLRLRITCPPLPELVYADRDMWEKIVLNLLSNALKHTHAGEISVCVGVVGDRIELIVSDTGIGIADVHLPRLFERFYRVSGTKARTHEGTGIGLALVLELVKLHGGSIAVESVVGKGTTFTVSIPCGTSHLPADRIRAARVLPSTAIGVSPYVEEALRWLPDADSADDFLRSTSDITGETPTSSPTGRIVLADDNADMRGYVAGLLVAGGFAVQAVGDGEAALTAAREHRPDLVLADVMIPRLDGFGLLRAMRADPCLRDVPVVFLSARADEDARIEGVAAGADDYLVKPFSAHELLARVGTHVRLALQRRETTRMLARAHAEAETARARLADLIADAPAMIAVLRGPEHVYELINAAYRESVGDRAILGKTIREAFPELVGQGLYELLDGVYATGRPHTASDAPVYLDRLGRGDLQLVYYNFVYQPTRDSDGAIDGILVLATDTTQQVEARQKVESLAAENGQLYEEAQEAIRVRDRFLAVASHELRTPVTSMLGYAQMLERTWQRGAMDEARVARSITTIVSEGHRLARLTQDLLDVSRIQEGQLLLRLEDMDLAASVRAAVQRYQDLVQGRHVFSLISRTMHT